TNLESNLICEFDRENIKEVLINLINNAINYTPPNGKITIDSNLNGQNVIIKIKDTGIGINNEDNANLSRYFGKVEHFGKGLDVITEGPGLGLYISKNIVQLHGGKLWFESKGKFKGTTFYFTLPC
ncbi:MAG: histidine kinase, partial [Candidatus Lokiarchaeota archaeon]|nr:histidine kinase [Candidatus Lokiarchaeota archaeon]MBD3200964.1 histidine kinase [Candidatus Lokiarchaeota archaeon]